MPPEPLFASAPPLPDDPLAGKVGRLNERYRHHSATAVLTHALTDPDVGPLALVLITAAFFVIWLGD